MDWQMLLFLFAYALGVVGGLYVGRGRQMRDRNLVIAGAIVALLGLGCYFYAATQFS